MVKIFNDVVLENTDIYPDDENLIICVGKKITYIGYVKFIDLGILTVYLCDRINEDVTLKKLTAFEIIILVGKWIYTIKLNTHNYTVLLDRSHYYEKELLMLGGFIAGCAIGYLLRLIK